MNTSLNSVARSKKLKLENKQTTPQSHGHQRETRFNCFSFYLQTFSQNVWVRL